MLTAPTIDDARAILRATFGYPEFRPGQARAIESVLAGRDTLVVLPTGGGKSLCYQVPALAIRGLTVVVSPLISLMKDQVDALERRGVAAAFINSTLTSAEVSDRLVRAQNGDLRLLYVAPERFDVGSTAERLKGIGVALLAVDEAHCISEWGHDFRPSYRRVGEVRQRLGNPPTIALTATATPPVREDIAHTLGLQDPEIIVTGFDRPNLSYGVVSAKGDREKDGVVVSLLRELAERDGTGIVYASTRKTVERLAQYLDDQGIAAAAYHAGLDDERRRKVQDQFMAERIRVIVATNSFGMGVDKSNVRLVVHYAMPGTLEAYYQEAGRAGRDGLPSRCIMLHAFPDRFTHEFFIKSALPDRALVESVHRRCQREASRDGVVSATADELAAGIGGKVSSKAVDSALRVLADAGVLRWDPDSAGLVQLTLLATPERIRDELGDGHEMERELLRACWRATKGKLRNAIIDLDGLPPGFNGFAGSWPMLQALEARQFVQVERVGGGLRLVDPRMSLDRVAIDWRSLDRRRQREFDKLEAVQRYAYATTCRRQALLRWFGDPDAKAECGSCDNCLGERRAAPAVRSGWGAQGGAPARERKPRDPNAARESRRKSMAKGGSVDEADADLLNALKACRAQLAQQAKVPHYVVFPDATLVALASRRPLTPAAMAGLPGVGPVKLDRYAGPFLDVIRAHRR